MSFITSFADQLAHRVERMFGSAEHATSKEDVKGWINRVVELTWRNQPQNVYNLIALACALTFVFYGINYLQKTLNIRKIALPELPMFKKVTASVAASTPAAAPKAKSVAPKRAASKKPAAKKAPRASSAKPRRAASRK